MRKEQILVCRNDKCERPFSCSGGRTGSQISREDINCPYCGTFYDSFRIADVFTTRKLTTTEQSRWKAKANG